MPYRLRARLSDIMVNADLNMGGRNIMGVNVLEGQKHIVAQYERLAKQVIIPTHAGGEALVVRDTTDRVSRAVFREDGTGQVGELSVGDLIFSHGYRFTEVDGGVALVNPRGEVVYELK